MGFSRGVASFELIPIVTSWNYNTTQSFVNRQAFTELTQCQAAIAARVGLRGLSDWKPHGRDRVEWLTSANTQIYTRFKLRIGWSTKVVVLRQPKSYGSKSLSGITHSNHKQKRAITVINKYGARHILLAVVRGERLNHWFPLDKRQNSSGLANSRAFYIKLVTNVIE